MLAVADVAVTVRNAQASASWWHEKAGFGVHRIDGPRGHAVMIAPPGERFLLHLCEGFEPVEPGNTGIAFVTDEFERLVARLQESGVKFTEPPRSEGPGGMAKFADPDGNVFWLLKAPTAFVRKETGRRAPAPSGRRKGSAGARRARGGGAPSHRNRRGAGAVPGRSRPRKG